MDLSKSETMTLCQRFLSAVGLPPGLDNEVAESIVWLVLRGYPTLFDLAQSIPAIAQDSTIDRRLDSYSGENFSAKDLYPDAWVAIADWLVVNCGKSPGESSRIQLSHVRYPYFLLPTLLQRSRQGYEFSAEGANSQVFFSNGSVWTNSGANELPFLESQDEMEIHCARISEIGYETLFQRFCIGSRMQLADDQLISAKNSRIDVGEEIYWRLKEVAAQCFVPASEQSRQRGAGAEVDDSI
ncbi:MAG: hypothetical protein OXI60_02195 [Acidiferrobacterales bacterium]|nr:hypothetical protein [Acidiferrobacterales bacterium]